MKKVIAAILLLSLLTALNGCGGGYAENTWFSEKKLEGCLVPQLPAPEGRKYVRSNDEDIYLFQNNLEFETYLQTVYTYLSSENFLYFGTRGEQINTLAGALTSYYFQSAETLDAFYVDDGYRFVFSDGSKDESGDVIFYVLLIFRTDTHTLEYGSKELTYNTKICLRKNSETALNGFYQLKNAENEK